MDPTEFLARHVPGYADLDGDERQAIAEFSLIWPAFEGAILEAAASPSGLVTIGLGLEAVVVATFALGCFTVIPDSSQPHVLSFAYHAMGDSMGTGCVNFSKISSLYKAL